MTARYTELDDGQAGYSGSLCTTLQVIKVTETNGESYILENAFLRANLDKTGGLVSLVHKQTG